MVIIFFFFFQAEDGIRDYKVTGVQTCALPILNSDNFWSRFDMQSPFVLSERSALLTVCLSAASTQCVGKLSCFSTQCVDRTDRCRSSWIDCNVYNPYCGTTLLLALLNAFSIVSYTTTIGPVENGRG